MGVPENQGPLGLGYSIALSNVLSVSQQMRDSLFSWEQQLGQKGWICIHKGERREIQRSRKRYCACPQYMSVCNASTAEVPVIGNVLEFLGVNLSSRRTLYIEVEMNRSRTCDTRCGFQDGQTFSCTPFRNGDCRF